MTYRIISTNDTEGTVTYEITHDCGCLQEQLRVAEYPTAGEILKCIEERCEQVCKEVAERQSVAVPDEIKKLIQNQ